jgi:hypothetical protein
VLDSSAGRTTPCAVADAGSPCRFEHRHKAITGDFVTPEHPSSIVVIDGEL